LGCAPFDFEREKGLVAYSLRCRLLSNAETPF
jgi:hypothetical protein